MSPPRFPVVLFERVVNQGVGADERDNPMTTLASVQCAIFHNRHLAAWQLSFGFRRRTGDSQEDMLPRGALTCSRIRGSPRRCLSAATCISFLQTSI